MINQVINNWHLFLRGEFPGGLDELLHDDVIFYSPVVYTPQKGKAITKLYLQAAASTLAPPSQDSAELGSALDMSASASSDPKKGNFRYVGETLSGDTAVLEFESEIDGKYVNGIDLIRCDESGKIVEFKVMIRPLQAINALHDAMKAMLEQMSD